MEVILGYLVGLLIPVCAMSIPVTAIILSYKKKTQANKIKELELQKENLELENIKQNSKIKLLEEENKNLDKVIFK
jgi:mannitol-specific phosphotransferase system IIBC component